MDLENLHKHYIHYITKETEKHNIDNISRTNAYEKFYIKHPDIKWSLLAGVVSRNAGWNMTDLFLPPFKTMLGKHERQQLFMTYERANWLIFSDAYPQLLIYQLSFELGKPMFQLLEEFNVSQFMINEWNRFWENRNFNRLMIALIINEQNVIQSPVIKQKYFKHRVFLGIPYLLQDFLFMNAVLLPTVGKEIYGEYVHDFTNISKRIDLGKKLAAMLFHENIYHKLLNFIKNHPHTGSRYDYEKHHNLSFPKSPWLRLVYPIITHEDDVRIDWYKIRKVKKKWLLPIRPNIREVKQSFYKKRNLLFAYHHLHRLWK
ncbi:DUF2515 family protein [Ornithinibacillus halophilus]|uniref:DUF2515 domain-containing protein n=1 Tax=Ornithinibacillus halophilus TaxID=930117 RepID=A0A1M5CNB4_9BACI|nr:DUF2515 family protein [Ornithinibacillus halophilus]SHF55902.1 Protein of unknown function [Ornithinibacillus halophilus]